MGSQWRMDEVGVVGVIDRARGQISKALEGLDRGAGEGRDASIHEVRKRVKKARALIRVARGAVGRKAVAKVDRRLRLAARPLSAVRDASVLLETLDDLADRPDALISSGAFAEAKASLEARRGRVAREHLEEGEALAGVAKALRSARRRLAKWDAGGDGSDPVGAYKRAYRRGRDQFQRASGEPSLESLHELRKRVKALAYQLGTIEADPLGPVARLRRLAGLLADELGEVHDLDILREFLVGEDESSPILEPLDRRRLDLARSALRRARVVFFQKPRAFAEKLEAAIGAVGDAHSGR